MPGSVLKWRIDVRPTAWVVYQYHQRYCSAAEYIEGVVSGFQVIRINDDN
jgi:hypothetical protein